MLLDFVLNYTFLVVLQFKYCSILNISSITWIAYTNKKVSLSFSFFFLTISRAFSRVSTLTLSSTYSYQSKF